MTFLRHPKDIRVWFPPLSPDQSDSATLYPGKRVRNIQVDILVIQIRPDYVIHFLVREVRKAEEAEYEASNGKYYYPLRAAYCKQSLKDLSSAQLQLEHLDEDADLWRWSKDDTAQVKDLLERLIRVFDFSHVRQQKKHAENLIHEMREVLQQCKGKRNIEIVAQEISRMEEVRKRITRDGEIDDEVYSLIKSVRDSLQNIVVRTFPSE